MARLLLALHRFAWSRPRAAIALCVALTAASVAVATRLQFSSDIVNILPRSSPAVDAVNEVLTHFRFTGQLLVYFEKTRPDAPDAAAMRMADGIERRMRGPDAPVIDTRITPEAEEFLAKMATDRGPLLLPENRMQDFLRRFETAEIRKAVKKNRRRLAAPGVGLAEALAARDPLDLFRDFYLPVLSAGRPAGTFDFSSGYYFCEGRRSMLMMIEGAEGPHSVVFARRFVGSAEKAIAEARAETPGSDGWRVSLLGGYPIAIASEATIKQDMKMTILSSIPPVLLMLLISLRRRLSLAVGFVALGLGIAWTFGLAGAAIGHLTGVTVGFAGLLAGMGIDFTIHFLNRYSHERAGGLTIQAASEATFAGAGPGVFIAMITSVASLLCLWVSAFQGLREFATLVGVGLFLVFAATALAFPLFIRVLARREVPDGDEPQWVIAVSWVGFMVYLAFSIHLLPWLGIVTSAACLLLMTAAGQKVVTAALVRRPWIAGALATAATLVAVASMLREPRGLPERETDVKNLRSEGDTILEVQERMRQDFGTGIDPQLVVVRGASEGEALEKTDAVCASLAALPDLHVQCVTGFVPPPSRQKLHIEAISKIDADRVVRDLDAALDAEGFDPAAFDEARSTLRTALGNRAPILPGSIRDPYFDGVRDRFLSTEVATGTVRSLIFVTPKDPLHLKSVRERTINEIVGATRAADPSATVSGFNVVVKEIDDRIGPDVGRATLAAGLLTFILAWVLFGSLSWATLALLPGLVGTAWLIGTLRLMEVKMNYLNLIVFPLMMGMGTDNGLHLVARFRELGDRDAARTVSSLWRGLTLTSLTTVVGFGSLAFAANRAMQSLGVAISVGMLSYLLSSLLVLPPILKVLETWKHRRPPRDVTP